MTAAASNLPLLAISGSLAGVLFAGCLYYGVFEDHPPDIGTHSFNYTVLSNTSPAASGLGGSHYIDGLGVIMVAGREASPKDVQNTERLMEYWSHGEGAAKINWGVPGDFNRCRVELSKYVGPQTVDGLCANLHHRATGAWPGHAPAEEAVKKAEGKGKK